MKSVSPLAVQERRELFKAAAAVPQQLAKLVAELSQQQITQRITGIEFSLQEQIWHLADLETRGFAKRLRLLLEQDDPQLEDFNGTQAAAERNYLSLSLRQGLRTFADTRLLNLWVLSGVSGDDWLRHGMLEGIGHVTLADVFRSMVQHDQVHLDEINTLLTSGELEHVSPAFVAA